MKWLMLVGSIALGLGLAMLGAYWFTLDTPQGVAIGLLCSIPAMFLAVSIGKLLAYWNEI